MIRVAVVDDHPVIRKGLKQLLELEDDLQVTVCIGEPETVVENLKHDPVDIVLLDLNMPKINGIQVLIKIKQANIKAKVIVFTVSEEPVDIHKAIRAGADGFLLKDEEPDQVINSIRDCVNGRHVVSVAIEDIVRDMVFNPPPENIHPLLAKLTEREKDVLRLIGRGKSNREIAQELFMAEGTAKVHAKRILSKLAKKNRIEVVLLCQELEGLI